MQIAVYSTLYPAVGEDRAPIDNPQEVNKIRLQYVGNPTLIYISAMVKSDAEKLKVMAAGDSGGGGVRLSVTCKRETMGRLRVWWSKGAFCRWLSGWPQMVEDCLS